MKNQPFFSMYKISLLFFLLASAVNCNSQELRSDSLEVNNFMEMERELYYSDLFNFSDNSLYGGLIGFKSAFFKQPLTTETNWKIDFSAFTNPFSIANQAQNIGIGYNPMFGQFSIMNQARYQISDKFSIGGNSFAGSSIFDPMPMNRPFNEMGIKGASMFMEYKVSKKLKIETRVSVTNRDSMFPFP